jgi:hypothetical protein
MSLNETLKELRAVVDLKNRDLKHIASLLEESRQTEQRNLSTIESLSQLNSTYQEEAKEARADATIRVQKAEEALKRVEIDLKYKTQNLVSQLKLANESVAILQQDKAD